MAQPLRTLSGGQRRRVELARILFSGAETLLLDEPTNHLDADSIVWLREFLRDHKGGLVVISHDVGLLEACVNKVLHLDANRAEIDIYNMGWKAYLAQRETDEKRRKRERINAENKAKTLTDQANKMRAKATKAQAAQSMLKRAEKLMAGVEGERRSRPRRPDQVPRARARAARPRSPRPSCRSPTARSRCSPTSTSRSTRAAGSSSSGSTVPARPPCCGSSAGVDRPDTGAVTPGHGLKLGYYAQEHETLDTSRTVLENLRTAAPPARPTPRPARCSARSCSPATTPTSRPRVLSGGEKTRLALAILVVSSANVLLLDEPTNNLDPASREEVLAAIRSYAGRDRAGHPRRGRRPRARARPGADPPRRRRGPLDRRLRRPGLARREPAAPGGAGARPRTVTACAQCPLAAPRRDRMTPEELARGRPALDVTARSRPSR